jgi:ABC-2 type transport system permease protein
MRPRRIAAVVLRHAFLLRESVSRLVPLFVWVAIDIVLWGFITRYLGGITSGNFVPTLLGAVLLWDFQTRVMSGVTMTFFEDVWSRNFLNIFASPITLPEYVSGLVASAIITSSISLLVMLALAMLVFGLSFAALGVLVIPYLLVLFVFGIALGIFGTGIVLRLGPASEWFIWPIPALISPFAGVFYPLSTLPTWMQWIGRAVPASYVFEGLRAVAAGKHPPADALLIGGALALVYLALAAWFFMRVHRHAVRTGLIARYSAETVS